MSFKEELIFCDEVVFGQHDLFFKKNIFVRSLFLLPVHLVFYALTESVTHPYLILYFSDSQVAGRSFWITVDFS
jgi:hypothetical protein